MNSQDLSKSQRRELRQLAGIAHTRELATELGKLEEAFGRWRAGEIDPHELSDEIHRFHDGPSRQLYTRYTDLRPTIPVASAIGRGILAESEVSEELRARLQGAIEFCRGQES